MFNTLNHNPRRSFDYAEAITNTRRALILFMLSVIARNGAIRDVDADRPSIPYRGRGQDTLLARYYRAATIDIVSVSNELPDYVTIGDVIGLVASDLAYHLHHTPGYIIPEDASEFDTYYTLRHTLAFAVAHPLRGDDVIPVTPHGWQLGRIASVGCGQHKFLMMDCADFKATSGHLLTPAPCFEWGTVPREPRFAPVVDLAEVMPVAWASDLAYFLATERYERRTLHRYDTSAIILPAPGRDMHTEFDLHALMTALTKAADDTEEDPGTPAPRLWHDAGSPAEGWTVSPAEYFRCACASAGVGASREVVEPLAAYFGGRHYAGVRNTDAAARDDVSARWYETPRLWLDRYRTEAGDLVHDRFDTDYDLAEVI